MTENPALLAAVAANQADDLPRLVYADWLDENANADRAEFIRVQIELERNRGTKHEAKLRERAAELIEAAPDWLGGLDPTSSECTIGFRRGFPETLAVHGGRLTAFADQLAAVGPTIRDVSVVGVRNLGATLGRCAFLETVRTLRLEDWPYRHDLEHLATSPHLPRLRHLSWWIGSRQDEAVCRTLSGAGWLPQLDKLELIQLHGGLAAGAMAEDCDANATRCQTICNRARGVTITSVHRAFDAEFTIPERVGQTLFAGTIRGGQKVLLFTDDPYGHTARMMIFDTHGRVQDYEHLHLPWSQRTIDGQLDSRIAVGHAIDAYKFRPYPIRVREFDDGEYLRGPRGRKFGLSISFVLDDPDRPDSHNRENWLRVIEEARSWLRSPDGWLGYDGREYRTTDDGECRPMY